MPIRIQRKRTRGWKMPEGAVYVGRPSQWGNPFKIGERSAVIYIDGLRRYFGAAKDASHAVKLFRGVLTHTLAHNSDCKDALEKLRGKDLCCWCPLSAPCHADVLLELANK